MYVLVPTSSVSYARPPRGWPTRCRRTNAAVPTANLFNSAITLMELELGVLLKESKTSRKAPYFEPGWTPTFGPLLPGVSCQWMTKSGPEVRSLARSQPQTRRDSLIAATALVHSMTVVTRNVRTSSPGCGVALRNPWT